MPQQKTSQHDEKSTFQPGGMQEVSSHLIKQQMETPHNNNPLNKNKEKRSSATKVLNRYHIPQVPPTIALQMNYITIPYMPQQKTCQ